jgi:hypothetical protein
MINKTYRSTEQLFAMVEWDMARAFISAAATEKREQCGLGVYEDECLTVKPAWGMGLLTPLRMSEAPVLKILPAGPHSRSANGGTPPADLAE